MACQLHSCSQKLEGATTACFLPAERPKTCPLTALSTSPNLWPFMSNSSGTIWYWGAKWGSCSRFWLAAAAVGKRALRAVLQVCSAAHWAAPGLSSKREKQIIFASWTSSIFRRGMPDKGQTWKRLQIWPAFSWLMFCVIGREGVSRTEGRCSCVVSWCGSAEKAEKEVLAFFHWTARLKTRWALIVEICNIS